MFRSSDEFHSDYIPGVGDDLSGAYAAPNVLFYQRFPYNDPYAEAISRLVPARYQSESNQMRGYVPRRFQSPTIADEQSVDMAVAAIVDNRDEIVSLGRLKAKRITEKWYAMTRIILGFRSTQKEILEHPLMQDVALPESETADMLAEMTARESDATD